MFTLRAAIVKRTTFASLTRATDAKTDKGTLNWTKGDYRKCRKLMQLV